MFRHCTIAELLEVRGGEGSAAARAHLKGCAACRDELDRVHQRVAALRALPSVTPPRDRWPLVRDEFRAWRRRRLRWLAGGSVAAAAVLALVIAWPGNGSPAPVGPSPELRALVERSQVLESALGWYGGGGRVVDGLAATAIADLEDRIAVIDAGIAGVQTGEVPTGDLERLWRQRVRLLDVLVQTHVQRTAYVGF